MGDPYITLLVIDSDQEWADSFQEMLAHASGAYRVVLAGDLYEATAHLAAGTADLALLGLEPGKSGGLQALNRLHAHAPDVPIIVLVDSQPEETAYQALREGAQDCLVKHDLHVSTWERAIRFALERQRGEATRSRLAAIVESSRDAIIGMSLEGLVVSWNPGAERIFGYTYEEAIGRFISILAPPDYPDEVPVLLELLKRGDFIKDFETRRIRQDQQSIHVAASLSPIKNSVGKIIGASMIARDIEERFRAEKERETLLHQLQATLAQVKTLSGLLPICASCKKIRDDQGYWTQVEVYVREHSKAEFTHGICPECAAQYRANLQLKKPLDFKLAPSG